jgi:hypothetical protein
MPELCWFMLWVLSWSSSFGLLGSRLLFSCLNDFMTIELLECSEGFEGELGFLEARECGVPRDSYAVVFLMSSIMKRWKTPKCFFWRMLGRLVSSFDARLGDSYPWSPSVRNRSDSFLVVRLSS